MPGACRLAVAVVIALVSASALGRAQSSVTSDAVVPFKIQVPETVLRDLQARLRNTRFPQEIPNTNWDYGTDLAYLRSLVSYWRDEFDWRAQERKLNEFPQLNSPKSSALLPIPYDFTAAQRMPSMWSPSHCPDLAFQESPKIEVTARKGSVQ
jgi:hypothetical protein